VLSAKLEAFFGCFRKAVLGLAGFAGNVIEMFLKLIGIAHVGDLFNAVI
jgi:hypothetical protein